MKNKIILTEYNPRWPEIYDREQAKILKVIGEKVIAIEHMGSTSVIGLAAKPVIDIIGALKSLADDKDIILPLKKIGYKYVPEYEINFPERRFFHRGPSETTGSINRHFHLHMVEKNSEFWIEHLLFRDYLRDHKDAAEEYENLKKHLVIESDGDINKYCGGKTNFINHVVAIAQNRLL